VKSIGSFPQSKDEAYCLGMLVEKLSSDLEVDGNITALCTGFLWVGAEERGGEECGVSKHD
jgi:hypothetical protein